MAFDIIKRFCKFQYCGGCSFNVMVIYLDNETTIPVCDKKNCPMSKEIEWK